MRTSLADRCGVAAVAHHLRGDALADLALGQRIQHQPGDGAPDSEKNELKPWLKECWCLPPQGSAEFVCAMEDVLEVYHREYQDNEVLVCLDETSKQLVQETRTPLPPRPGAARAYDYEYQRNGVSNLFMLFAPLEGWRRVEVTDRRTRTDWAADSEGG